MANAALALEAWTADQAPAWYLAAMSLTHIALIVAILVLLMILFSVAGPGGIALGLAASLRAGSWAPGGSNPG